MDLDTLIKELTFIRNKKGNLKVTLDDLYTPASQYVDGIFTEYFKGESDNGEVVVIRN